MSTKILYICSEVSPYIEHNCELAQLGRVLPQQMQEQGAQIRIFTPRYGAINERRGQLHEVIRLSGMNLIIAETDHQLIIKVASIAGARVQVYFIDNEDFFSRKGDLFVDEGGVFFADNDERAIFFARGVIETVKKLRWSPDIVHCQGWISAVAPAYMRKVFKSDPIFAKSKIVVSLLNDSFDGLLDASMPSKLKKEGIKNSEVELGETIDYNALMRFAINNCDAVVVGKDANNEAVEYARSTGKLMLDASQLEAVNENVNYWSTYKPFYEELISC